MRALAAQGVPLPLSLARLVGGPGTFRGKSSKRVLDRGPLLQHRCRICSAQVSADPLPRENDECIAPEAFGDGVGLRRVDPAGGTR